ncbi:MAG: alpha-galactosidase [Clostridia bacterium]|nr:alpha-galactosidase [Clostridia bacterium]
MSVTFDARSGIITLDTVATTYQMKLAETGHLLHLYYGRRIPGDDLTALIPRVDVSFAPDPYECRATRTFSLDVQPQEYPAANVGDFRVPALIAESADGVYGDDLRCVSHAVRPGKYALEGLPCADAGEEDCQTLAITLRDAATGLQVELLYGVYEKEDVITRAVKIVNGGDKDIVLHRASSAALDVPFGDWQLIHFQGRHAMERQMERVDLMHGIQSVGSTRGASSHHHNPFVILCGREAGEEQGECYGVMPVYSGSHRTDVELDQTGDVRLVTGIHPDMFRWTLKPGEAFTAPEVILTFTHEGMGALSRRYHRFLREHIIRGKWNHAARPVLLNNWEATYFDFNTGKILAIAEQAAALGADLLVLDDGWFGQRNDDNRALGDWFVNEEKLPGGLDALIKGVNGLGLKFGIWMEPEMVSEDSDLYRAHPDWALTVPGRKPTMGRNQLVLDMSRGDVRDYLYDTIAGLLRKHHIEYVKWDMNRNMTDVYSRALPADRQGELFHRYILGVYDLLERLTTDFPDVLWEGCSGGGGRFDAGMLRYHPQIWLSDDTDAIERLYIQHGSSFGYPVSAMGAHVSACPNHQTGRTVALGTRAVVAMSGTFGYELDPNALTDGEREQVKAQIARFKRWYDVIQNGDYYRLAAPGEGRFAAWQTVSADRGEALVSAVITHAAANLPGIHLRLRGLDPEARYEMDEMAMEGCQAIADAMYGQDAAAERPVYSGAALMYAGVTLPVMGGDYPAAQLHFTRVK